MNGDKSTINTDSLLPSVSRIGPLEERYIELLEKRIASLEALVEEREKVVG